jgi:cellobiose epimerase
MKETYDNSSIGSAWDKLADEIQEELNAILHYWERNAVNTGGFGFVGRIDENNQIHAAAPRGAVLNTRILWTYSAVYRQTLNPLHLELAGRAFFYVRKFITDREKGGLFWSVDHEGKMLDSHKQIYAQAFGIYAMSEYYRVTKDSEALRLAQDWYRLIEEHGFDAGSGGYIDAFARDWTAIDDMRLSAKDENASKTMNTHLHVVEAYANLFEVWPAPELKNRIIELLKIFDGKIINKSSWHLTLFFNKEWKPDDAVISYGHDIEAAWLLLSCAESIRDEESIRTAKMNALKITDAAMEGLDADGGLWYEYDQKRNELIMEKHWWPQAEALIGFCNAWQLSRNDKYKNALIQNWLFIKNHILDRKQGEWFWGIDKDKKPMSGQDKIGMWKGPYHNGRACLELLKRLQTSVRV